MLSPNVNLLDKLKEKKPHEIPQRDAQKKALVPNCNLPQQDLPKSKRTNCTMYGSKRFTYHHGTRSDLVSEHVSCV